MNIDKELDKIFADDPMGILCLNPYERLKDVKSSIKLLETLRNEGFEIPNINETIDQLYVYSEYLVNNIRFACGQQDIAYVNTVIPILSDLGILFSEEKEGCNHVVIAGIYISMPDYYRLEEFLKHLN